MTSTKLNIDGTLVPENRSPKHYWLTLATAGLCGLIVSVPIWNAGHQLLALVPPLLLTTLSQRFIFRDNYKHSAYLRLLLTYEKKKLKCNPVVEKTSAQKFA